MQMSKLDSAEKGLMHPHLLNILEFLLIKIFIEKLI